MTAKIYGILTALFILYVQLFVFDGCDIARMLNDQAVLFGLVGLALVAWKMHLKMWLLLIPVGYACAVALFHWVPGYTSIRIAEILGYTGLTLFIANSETKWILRVVALTVLIQTMYTLFPLEWAMHYSYTDSQNPFLKQANDLYGWGLFRHHIRYATWMYAGLIASLTMIDTEKSRWWRIAAYFIAIVAIVSITLSYSNMIIGVTVTTIFAWIWIKKSKLRYAAAFAVLALVAFFIFKPDGFSPDIYRIENLRYCLVHSLDSIQTLLTGHGVGAYTLNVACHPHNEIMNVLYDQGILGILALIYFLGSVLLMSRSSNYLFIGIALYFISTCTNSLRYPDVWFMFAVLCGCGIAKSAKNDYDVFSRRATVTMKMLLYTAIALASFRIWRATQSDIAVSLIEYLDSPAKKAAILAGGNTLESRYWASVFNWNDGLWSKNGETMKKAFDEMSRIQYIAPNFMNVKNTFSTMVKFYEENSN